MTLLSPAQIDDLRKLLDVCHRLQTEAVIIGATAYRLLLRDENRLSMDMDLAVAIELEDLSRLEAALFALGWKQHGRSEHQWRSTEGNWIDLLPAGPSLRARKQVVWPKSGWVMSLVGFDHVFREAVEVEIAPGTTFKVVPPVILCLLKMVSYLDDPYRREKDRSDLQGLWGHYEEGSERIFSEEVLEAKLPDIDLAGAFLLGLDLARIATKDDTVLVDSFATRFTDENAKELQRHNTDLFGAERQKIRFQEQLAAFVQGFRWTTS